MEKQNSVIYLKAIKSLYNINRPYLNPCDEEIFGTGFIIDISKGLVVTCSSIVSNSISIIGRSFKTGNRDLKI